MSWGGSEFASQTYYDNYFTQPKVVYFAASGRPGVWWPPASPNLVSGTSISRNLTRFPAGAGVAIDRWRASRYRARPGYQTEFRLWCKPGGAPRTLPPSPTLLPVSGSITPLLVDLWWHERPTPIWAGIVNSAGSFSASSPIELTTVYKNLGNTSDIADIAHGSCGPNQGYLAGAGWDFCTGAGSPVSKLGK